MFQPLEKPVFTAISLGLIVDWKILFEKFRILYRIQHRILNVGLALITNQLFMVKWSNLVENAALFDI